MPFGVHGRARFGPPTTPTGEDGGLVCVCVCVCVCVLVGWLVGGLVGWLVGGGVLNLRTAFPKAGLLSAV